MYAIPFLWVTLYSEIIFKTNIIEKVLFCSIWFEIGVHIGFCIQTLHM